MSAAPPADDWKPVLRWRRTSDGRAIVRPDWQPNATYCAECRSPLGLRALRACHHCRACGRCLCGECAARWLALPPAFGYGLLPVRVCRRCERRWSVLDFDRTVRDSGLTEGRLCVLLHGGTGNREAWRSLCVRCCAAGR